MSTKKKGKIADSMSTEEKVHCINDLVGNNKVNILGTRRVDTAKGTVFWVVDFEDRGKTNSIECDDEYELEKIIDEFRGKNNKTVAADNIYLTLNGWSSKDIKSLGFAIRHVKIRITSRKQVKISKHIVPQACGGPYLQNKVTGKRKKKWEVTERSAHTSDIYLFANFTSGKQFDRLISWMNTKWPDHEKILRELGVEKSDNGIVSKWERQVAKDGTSQMELICTEVAGLPFTECFRNEIISATEGMSSKTCSLGLRKKEKAEKICVHSEELM